MNTTAFMGLVQAELMQASCRTALGIPPKEEYYIPVSSVTKIIETLQEILDKNFASKELLIEVLSRECNIGDVLEVAGLEIVSKDGTDFSSFSDKIKDLFSIKPFK